VERVFEHLERSMVAIGFIDPRYPKKLMPRLRRLLSRTRLEMEEVDILRGICTQIDRQVALLEKARREP
jgi:tRNA/rRNA methyltransferase